MQKCCSCTKCQHFVIVSNLENVILFQLNPNVSIISIIRFVVHYKFVIHEVEAVRAGLEGVLHHVLDGVLVKTGELVDVLAAVDAVRDAEAKVKVESFQVLITEKVSFNHSEFVYGLASNLEFYCSTNSSKFQKLKFEYLNESILSWDSIHLKTLNVKKE